MIYERDGMEPWTPDRLAPKTLEFDVLVTSNTEWTTPIRLPKTAFVTTQMSGDLKERMDDGEPYDNGPKITVKHQGIEGSAQFLMVTTPVTVHFVYTY